MKQNSASAFNENVSFKIIVELF